ncbi:MAG TPA: DUF5671 domain-containing protein [Candidatus Paceibacterota bacterium]
MDYWRKRFKDDILQDKMNNDVRSYARSQLDQGVDQKLIKSELLASGWDESYIEKLLGEVVGGNFSANTQLVVAPVSPSMVEIFMGFVSFSLLWTGAFALGTLYFQIINKVFPDPLLDGPSRFFYLFSSPTSDALLRSSMASLFVVFPLYVAILFFMFRRFSRFPSKRESRLVKWFTYIILYATAMTAVGDLSSMISNFLEGELSGRTFLKAATIFVIAGLIITFYAFERKKVEFKKGVSSRIFLSIGGFATVLVLAGIILGFFLGNSPGTERNRKFDSERATNLQYAQSAIEGYAAKNNALPISLEVLKSDTTYNYYAKYLIDPETRKSFEYTVVLDGKSSGIAQYKLCANFALSALTDSGSGSYQNYGGSSWGIHDRGRVCKDMNVTLSRSLFNYNNSDMGGLLQSPQSKPLQ